MGESSFYEWFAIYGYYLLYGISLFTLILFLIFYFISRNKEQIKGLFRAFAKVYVFIGIPINMGYYLIRHLFSDMVQWQAILGIIIGTLTSTILIFYRKGNSTVKILIALVCSIFNFLASFYFLFLLFRVIETLVKIINSKRAQKPVYRCRRCGKKLGSHRFIYCRSCQRKNLADKKKMEEEEQSVKISNVPSKND